MNMSEFRRRMKDLELDSEIQQECFLMLLSSGDTRDVSDMTQKFFQIWVVLPLGEKIVMKTYLKSKMPQNRHSMIDSLFDAFTAWDDAQKYGAPGWSCKGLMNVFKNSSRERMIRNFLDAMMSTWSGFRPDHPQKSTAEEKGAKEGINPEKKPE